MVCKAVYGDTAVGEGTWVVCWPGYVICLHVNCRGQRDLHATRHAPFQSTSPSPVILAGMCRLVPPSSCPALALLSLASASTVYAVAHALQALQAEGRDLRDGGMLLERLGDVRFQGLSDQVSFNENMDPASGGVCFICFAC